MKIAGRDAFLKLHWDPPRASHGAIKIAAYSARDTFLSGEVKRASYWTEMGILHYVKWNDLVQVNSPQSISLTCRKCPWMYFNGRQNINSEMLMQYFGENSLELSHFILHNVGYPPPFSRTPSSLLQKETYPRWECCDLYSSMAGTRWVPVRDGWYKWANRAKPSYSENKKNIIKNLEHIVLNVGRT